jgi:hypothetical protein
LVGFPPEPGIEFVEFYGWVAHRAGISNLPPKSLNLRRDISWFPTLGAPPGSVPTTGTLQLAAAMQGHETCQQNQRKGGNASPPAPGMRSQRLVRSSQRADARASMWGLYLRRYAQR